MNKLDLNFKKVNKLIYYKLSDNRIIIKLNNALLECTNCNNYFVFKLDKEGKIEYIKCRRYKYVGKHVRYIDSCIRNVEI